MNQQDWFQTNVSLNQGKVTSHQLNEITVESKFYYAHLPKTSRIEDRKLLPLTTTSSCWMSWSTVTYIKMYAVFESFDNTGLRTQRAKKSAIWEVFLLLKLHGRNIWDHTTELCVSGTTWNTFLESLCHKYSDHSNNGYFCRCDCNLLLDLLHTSLKVIENKLRSNISIKLAIAIWDRWSMASFWSVHDLSDIWVQLDQLRKQIMSLLMHGSQSICRLEAI